MNSLTVILILLGYLGILFLIAHWAEKRKNSRFANNPIIYSLSIAVYCTAWTYYGSVGMAAKSGLMYLAIYIGPVITAPLWILTLRKIIRISRTNNISSIADFLSLRYANSRTVGALVSAIIIVGILPYISLQLKAISETFHLITDTPISSNIFTDSTTYVSLTLAFFAAYYGTRYVDASAKRSGVMAAVAIESLLKLVFFLIIGIYTTYFVFNGFGDISEKASQLPYFAERNTLGGVESALNWAAMLLLSSMAIFLLPRQFQTMVVENKRESHIKTAIWLFPLYLLVFNLFVYPIAWGGNLMFGESANNADMFALLIPKEQGNNLMTLLVFLGGFSASISMVVVSSISLSTMLSNNILIPYTFIGRFQKKEIDSTNKYIVNLRRIGIISLIIIAFVIYKIVAFEYSLVSIGLVSFTIIAQLAPSFFGALYWRRGSKKGMISGLIAGFLICVYTLIIPYTLGLGSGPNNFVENGPFGIELLKPFQLFGLDILDPIPHALFWSLLVNAFLYFAVSVSFEGNYRERNYAELYVDVDKYLNQQENAFIWKGTAYTKDIEKILIKFLGQERTSRALRIFNQKYSVDSNQEMADARLVKFAENLLTGRIGTASAKILISSVVKEEKITLAEVLKILEESKENIDLNKQLTETSRQLASLTDKLQLANEELRVKDKQKDEFLDTVTHELRTPITAIRASSEILKDDDELPAELKQQFLDNIITESDRLNRLINTILDLDKLESGKQKLNLSKASIKHNIEQAVDALSQLIKQKGISVQINIENDVVCDFDEDRITQVLTNIISNAIKFCPETHGEIGITLHELSDKIEISVADNGSGIPANDLDRIFDKFYQSENQNTKKPIGSGLGLAISKNIVQLHRGEIWAKSNHTGGTSLHFTISKTLNYAEDINS
jgi:signal transduction histidine kinase